jgi:hypothetical protein
LADVVTQIADLEAPVHVIDVTSRVAAQWRVQRVRSRIAARIMEGIRHAEQAGRLRVRGEFVWLPAQSCAVRSRAGWRIPAERVCPEEYREAVRLVLRAAGMIPLPRPKLVAEVRRLLGFARMSNVLELAIHGAIGELLTSEDAQEGSQGIRLWR